MEICLYTYIHMCILLPEEKTEGAFVGDLGIQEFHYNFFFQNPPPWPIGAAFWKYSVRWGQEEGEMTA